MKYYAVIDTNVIVSAMLFPDSIPGTILKYVYSRVLVPLVNETIVKEYEDVLNRDKFGFYKEDIAFVINNIKENCLFLKETKTNEQFIDKNDIVFYEITLSSRKDMNGYLVTGNIKHFPNKPFVVTPKEMVDIINSN